MSDITQGPPPEDAQFTPPAYVLGGGIVEQDGVIVAQFLVNPTGTDEAFVITLLFDPPFAEAIGVSVSPPFTEDVQEDNE